MVNHTQSTDGALADAGHQSLTVKSGLRRLVKSVFREMVNFELPRKTTDMQEGVAKVVDFIEARPGQNRLIAITRFTDRFRGYLTGLKP